MYHLILFAVNSTFFTPFPKFFFRSTPHFSFICPQKFPPPLKNFYDLHFSRPPPHYFCCAPISSSHFLSPPKKWGCKPKKVGGVNTQNTPGFGAPGYRVHCILYSVHCTGYTAGDLTFQS